MNQNIIEVKDGCIAKAMRVLGNKWTALIIRDLYLSPKRFCELERSVSKINPRTLTKRLILLEGENIIEKIRLNGASLTYCYRLTQKGKDLLPILKQMSEWGNKYFDD